MFTTSYSHSICEYVEKNLQDIQWDQLKNLIMPDSSYPERNVLVAYPAYFAVAIGDETGHCTVPIASHMSAAIQIGRLLDDATDKRDFSGVMNAVGLAFLLPHLLSDLPQACSAEIQSNFSVGTTLAMKAQGESTRCQTWEQYIQKIVGTTSLLTSMYAWGGTRCVTDNPLYLHNAKKIGHHYGMIDAVSDDIQDLVEDICAGILTFPVLWGLKQKEHVQYSNLCDLLRHLKHADLDGKQERALQIRDILKEMGGMKESKNFMAYHYEQMMFSAEQFPESQRFKKYVELLFKR